jgi:hypothetical protein
LKRQLRTIAGKMYRFLLGHGKKLLNNIRYSTPPPVGVISVKDYISNTFAPNLYTQISPGTIISRSPPLSIDREIHWKFVQDSFHTSPETFTLVIPNGRCYGYGIVITPDNYVIQDILWNFDKKSGSYWIINEGNLSSPKKLAGTVGVISAPSADSYFHWMFDILPRFGLLKQTTRVDSYYVNNQRPFQKEYLNLLKVPEEQIIPVEKKSHICAETLIVPSLPGISGNMTAYCCSFLQNLLHVSIKDYPSTEKKRSRIFVSRQDGTRRNLLNEDEIYDLLVKYDFERITLTNMPVIEQMKRFSMSEVIVAPHGAGLSNLVFCLSGTKVVEFFSPGYVNVCFWALCQLRGLEYGYLIGEGRNYDDYVDPHLVYDNIVISADKLKTLMEEMDITF